MPHFVLSCAVLLLINNLFVCLVYLLGEKKKKKHYKKLSLQMRNKVRKTKR